ncbi:MAG: Eco57I restriction-modification methylase domain-containing protein [Methanobrevibacter sp.]|nr:Eco57I restriction-modification methylase domain-containing protein [Methanobrevibacter sp.]
MMDYDNRRKKGQFYTPTLFVDYAHKMINEQFGDDWKEKFVVWDNCSGTKNLTRDYYFKELYSSTLEDAELEISERYNREGTAFQFDFLNDSLDKLPQGLREALEQNKPIIFFINPPYAMASNRNETSKEGCAKTMINEQMLAEKIGGCSQNLYAQFLYRIMKIKEQYNLTNLHIALFSPTNWLCGKSFKHFRVDFFEHFSFNNGVLFNAGHFNNVAANWGISFSIWNSGVNTNNNDFNYKLIDNVDGEIKVVGEKVVYNIDESKTASDWAKESVKGNKTFDVVNLSSGICVRDKENNRGKNFENAFGFINNGGNSVCQNSQTVALFTSAYGNGNGFGINETNFYKCTALFSARKLIESNWTNAEDEYFAPNTDNEKWQEFVSDSVVYSLFTAFSQQSSLRQVEYKGKLWDIKNEFFFMSKEEIMSLANDNGFDFTFNDARVSNERYVYSKLQGIELSAEAKAVLDKAIELTKASFKYRELFDEEHSEYQIMNWDCGWYQIKGMLKEFMPNELKEFNELFKALADKMRPMVYELRFLKY